MISPEQWTAWLNLGKILGKLFPSRSKCLLVVEDNTDDLELLAVFLRHRNLKHDVAKTGEEALARLRSSKYGLLFLDIRLPGMNGWKLLKHIKDEFPEIKVIITCGEPSDLREMPTGLPFMVMLKPPTLHGIDQSTK